GLVKLVDLGEYWETATGLPIPLGGIVVHRDLPEEIQQRVNRVLRRSVEYAFAYPDSAMPFVRTHAQAMDETVMKAHIDLYVSHYTLDLGDTGRAAVRQMFRLARAQGVIPVYREDFFLN
ncbi:MAG: MqnA/MqnD/SBP family protein, partial [Saprospiraceae bacterium]